MENPAKIDDIGYPHSRKPPYSDINWCNDKTDQTNK
jgi:hypothetical protein